MSWGSQVVRSPTEPQCGRPMARWGQVPQNSFGHCLRFPSLMTVGPRTHLISGSQPGPSSIPPSLCSAQRSHCGDSKTRQPCLRSGDCMEMEGEDGVTSLCLGPTGRAKAEGEMLEERGGSLEPWWEEERERQRLCGPEWWVEFSPWAGPQFFFLKISGQAHAH